MSIIQSIPFFTVLATLAATVGCSHTPAASDATPAPAATPATGATAATGATPVTAAVQPSLEGTSWEVVKFQGSDGTTIPADDPAKYTLSFEPGGRLTARLDCNRGQGTWTSSGPSELKFGPLALTRAFCPPGLHNQLVRHWESVAGYVLKDGLLFISLIADGGVYELRPRSETSAAATP